MEMECKGASHLLSSSVPCTHTHLHLHTHAHTYTYTHIHTLTHKALKNRDSIYRSVPIFDSRSQRHSGHLLGPGSQYSQSATWFGQFSESRPAFEKIGSHHQTPQRLLWQQGLTLLDEFILRNRLKLQQE